MTKSLPISKQMVYESYLKVAAKDGAAGIDQQSMEMFNAQLADNLYKLWNRMTSGSYFPPAVRTVLIPKKQGGLRPLGIPTVSDRIAQGVVKDYLEPKLEPIFHSSSFGYRPGKNAHQALEQCLQNCYRYSWVLDVDIKGFFDNLSHEVMMKLLQRHTQEKWVQMYVERWLQAGVEQPDGSIVARQKGTPQGGVISPLLADLYLHYGFDKWMEQENRHFPFERYADDIVIHCYTKAEAEILLQQLRARMEFIGLELHEEKTRIVYCKNGKRHDKGDQESFTFLGYSFQPRSIRCKYIRTKQRLVFTAAISQQAKKGIREQLRKWFNPMWSTVPLVVFAKRLNPKIRGWINYYTRFNPSMALDLFGYLNGLIRRWISSTYKIVRKAKVYDKYRDILKTQPNLFYHWKAGVIN